MKNFKEKAIKDLSKVTGGAEEAPTITVRVTANWSGWFDGSLFRDGKINEFDERRITVSNA